MNGIIEEANKRIQPAGTGESLATQDTLDNQDLQFKDSFKLSSCFVARISASRMNCRVFLKKVSEMIEHVVSRGTLHELEGKAQ